MGTELRFTLSASDADSDTVTFLATDLPANSRLEGDSGKFRFKPAPSQVGNHTVTFIATDGKATHSQEVVFTVQAADEDQVTALESRVLDGNAFSETGAIVPIPGVRITVEGSTVSTTTNAQGEFTISGIPHGAKIVHLDASGITAPNGHQYGNFSGRLKIEQNVLNRPYREYMLPRVNPDHIATVRASSSTTVSNSDINVSMTVPADVARNADGTAYTGPLSISMVPTDAAPRELPELFSPSLLITLQPVDLRFSTPVPITFPNLDGLPAGALVELYSLSERGGFEQVGLGRVSSNGETITTIQGGIRNTTWHFVTIATPSFKGVADGTSGTDNDNNTESNFCLGSIICVSTGMLRERYELPNYKASYRDYADPTLVYTNVYSLRNLNLVPSYQYEVRTVRMINTTPMPPSIIGMSFELEGQMTPEVFFDISTITGDLATASFSSGQQLNTQGLETGVYPVTARLNLISGPPNRRSRRMIKNTFYFPIISPETEFGLGWRWEGLQSLHGLKGALNATSPKIMLVLDNFRYIVFTRLPDGSYSSPNGDTSTFKVLSEPNGGFERKTKEGMVYRFNQQGFLTQKTDRYNLQTSYFYNTDGSLSYIVHKNGLRTTFSYGSDGWIDSVTDPANRVTRFTHNAQGYITRITDPDNHSRDFEYNGFSLLVSQVDKLGQATNYAYDSRGNIIYSIRPDATILNVRSANSRIIETGLGTETNPFIIKAGEERVSEFVDSLGHLTQFKTNNFGAIIEITNALGGRIQITRDGNNNMTLIVDENGNTSSYTYDDYENVQSITTPEGTMTYTYLANPASNFHQPVTIVDRRGNRTLIYYDVLGNIISIRDPENQLTSMSYRRYLLESIRNSVTRTGFLYEYDRYGNVTFIKSTFHQTLGSFTYDNAGNVLTKTNSLGNTITYTYDSFNRVRTQTDARNGVVSFTYDAKGNLSSVNDQEENITSFVYDEMDRVIKRTDPLGRQERFTYDGNNNMVQRIDKNGAIIDYQYDALDRLQSVFYPDDTSETYTYDAKGNMRSASDSDSSISYTYDSANRMITASTIGSNAQPDITLTYSYDGNGNVIGLRASREDLFFEYNKSNNLKKAGHQSDIDPYFLRFFYDNMQRVKKIDNYPNDISASISYTLLYGNQISNIQYSSLSDSDSISSFRYTYNLNNSVTSLTTSRGTLTGVNAALTYGYDVLNQLTSATRPIGTGEESFTYDLAGNRLQKEGETVDSSFNKNNQLTNDKTFTYTYDKNGNLTKKTNSTTGEVTEYTWDYKNQLIGIKKKVSADSTETTQTISYKYDPFGRRIQKNVDGTLTKYVYDRDHIFLEFNAQDLLLAKYVHGMGVDQPLRMERTYTPYHNSNYVNQYFYYLRDRLGNITEILNVEGTVIQRYVYDAFGKITIYDDQNNVITPDSPKYLKNPFTYTGREYDPETGLYYFRARYYDPEVGRFLNEDTIGFYGGDVNLYRFVYNNPINLVDPFGEFTPIGNVICAASVILLNQGTADTINDFLHVRWPGGKSRAKGDRAECRRLLEENIGEFFETGGHGKWLAMMIAVCLAALILF